MATINRTKKPVPRKKPAKKAAKTTTTRQRRKGIADMEKELASLSTEVRQNKIVSTQTEAKEGESTLLKKCKFPLCKNLVDETGVGIYCTHTCAMWDRKRLARQAEGQSLYLPRYANEDLHAYLQQCELSHRPFYTKVGEMLIPIKRIQVPTIEGYGNFIGFRTSRMMIWAKAHAEFREAMAYLKQVQKTYLLDNGISGSYNAKITQLMLMNNHGMKERTENLNRNLFGIVREVYEKADQYEMQAQLDDPFDGVLPEGHEDETDV